MEPSEKLLFTRAEAALMLSLSVSTVDVAIARGMLRARRNGRRVLIEKREIEKFSRADHPHIWAPDGRRGSSVEGRECFDCAKSFAAGSPHFGCKPLPAVRFFKRLPLCQACFERRAEGARSRPTSADGSIPSLRSSISIG